MLSRIFGEGIWEHLEASGWHLEACGWHLGGIWTHLEASSEASRVSIGRCLAGSRRNLPESAGGLDTAWSEIPEESFANQVRTPYASFENGALGALRLSKNYIHHQEDTLWHAMQIAPAHKSRS